MRPAVRDATPTGFWVVLPPPSRARACLPDRYQTIRPLGRACQSCHGLFRASLGRVGCRFSGTRLSWHSPSNAALYRNSPQPILSWAAIRSWV